MIIAEAKNKEELVRRKELWVKDLKARFEEETKDLPNYMKRRNIEARTASKIESAYSQAVNQIIEEETKSKKAILERIRQTASISESSYKVMVRREKSHRNKRILAGAATALLLAGTVFTAKTIAKGQDKEAQGGGSAIIDTIPSEPQGGAEETLKMPEIVSYENANGTFQYLHNTVDVNYWAYETVSNELEAYNKAHPDNAYQIDMDLINGAILCGMQMRESSGQLNSNKDNPNYQGPYSISTKQKNVAELNNVSMDLTGQNLIDPENIKNDIQDPRIGAKACMYHMIQNYEYLKSILPEGVEITQNILIDSYLYGATGVKNRIISGEYKGAMPYSARIIEYAEVFKVYKDALDKQPWMRDAESTPEGRAAFQKLNEITQRYSNKDTHEREGSAAEEME